MKPTLWIKNFGTRIQIGTMLCLVVACGTKNADNVTPIDSQKIGRGIINGTAGGDASTGALLASGIGICTGTLIAPNLVLTAGHCAKDTAYFVKGAGPMSKVDPASAGWPKATVIAGDPSSDWALMLFTNKQTLAGPYGAIDLSGSDFIGSTVDITGYGKDEKGAYGVKKSGQMKVIGAGTKQLSDGPIAVGQTLSPVNGQCTAPGDSGAGVRNTSGKIFSVISGGGRASQCAASATSDTSAINRPAPRTSITIAMLQNDTRCDLNYRNPQGTELGVWGYPLGLPIVNYLVTLDGKHDYVESSPDPRLNFSWRPLYESFQIPDEQFKDGVLSVEYYFALDSGYVWQDIPIDGGPFTVPGHHQGILSKKLHLDYRDSYGNQRASFGARLWFTPNVPVFGATSSTGQPIPVSVCSRNVTAFMRNLSLLQ